MIPSARFTMPGGRWGWIRGRRAPTGKSCSSWPSAVNEARPLPNSRPAADYLLRSWAWSLRSRPCSWPSVCARVNGLLLSPWRPGRPKGCPGPWESAHSRPGRLSAGGRRPFLGREAFVARLAEAVREQTGVVGGRGSSGSGKSSVVFAGLLPVTRATTQVGWSPIAAPARGPSRLWLRRSCLPWHPELNATDRLIETQKLAGALLRQESSLEGVAEHILAQHPGARRLLLVVDQFEETYTLCPESEARRRFVEGLLGAVREDRPASLTLLLTLRADFMGHALLNRSFADMLRHGLLLLGPMASTELRSAIERPGGQHGAAFEPGLVDRILDDVGEEPGALLLCWNSW